MKVVSLFILPASVIAPFSIHVHINCTHALHVLSLPLAAHAARCAKLSTDTSSSTSSSSATVDNTKAPAVTNSPTLTTNRKPTLPRVSSKELDDDEEEGVAQLKAELEQKKSILKCIIAELHTLRGDKELLLSRNRSLEEDLQQRDRYAKMTSDPQDGIPSEQKWFIPRENFTMEDAPINNTTSPYERFFSVHMGTFRMSDVTVRQVRNTSRWTADVYKTFVRDVEKMG